MDDQPDFLWSDRNRRAGGPVWPLLLACVAYAVVVLVVVLLI